ncbi:MAG: 50S ribosomal protein L25 [Vicinamibacterales bacterium]
MEAVLEAVRRETLGRNNAGRLRRQGQIPAVIYGGKSEAPESLSVDPKQLLRILHSESGANTLISLKLEGAGDTRVLVKEYQLHPVRHQLLHADFYRVAMDQVLRVTVPVQLTGDARGIKQQGAVVDFVHRELTVECLPADIPENITVDITNLMLHDGVRVRDLETGGKWKPLSDADLLIVHLVAPKTAVEPAPADAAAPVAGAAAEPEVIKKGKVEKEGEKE